MQLVYIISIAIQIIAGIMAIIYIRKTPHVAWIFIALALSHVVFTRLIYSMGLALPEVLPEIIGSTMIFGAVIFINRTFKRYNQNITQLKSLCDIDRVMLSRLGHKGVMNAVVDKLNATLNIDAAAVLTVNNNHNHDNRFNAFASYNLSKKLQFYLQMHSNGFVSSVIENRSPLIITKIADDEDEDFLTTLRSEGFLSYMAAPIIIKGGEAIGVLTLYSRTPRRYTSREIEFINAMNSQIAFALDRTQLIERIQEMSFESVRTLVEAIEIRDPYTRGHSIHVADLCSMVGRSMGFNEKELTLMEFAGLLHDVGKIAIPETILRKHDALTGGEWAVIRKHPLNSVKIIEPVLSLKPIQDWILNHHERWDGAGYPSGNTGGDIPLQSRILAVCDTYSAMIGNRPYRRNMTVEQAKREIERVAGTQLDPMVVDIFLNSDIHTCDQLALLKSNRLRKNVDRLSRALNVPSQRKLEPQLRFL
jgi:HD-GYP domain-containing protein (c-di-GMP phosphodiesterase class II)